MEEAVVRLPCQVETLNFGGFGDTTVDGIRRAIDGEDMLQIHLTSKSTAPVVVEEMVSTQLQECVELAASLRLPVSFRATREGVSDHLIEEPIGSIQAATDEIFEGVQQRVAADPFAMLTVEDKDPSILWLGDARAHVIRLAAQVVNSGPVSYTHLTLPTKRIV